MLGGRLASQAQAGSDTTRAPTDALGRRICRMGGLREPYGMWLEHQPYLTSSTVRMVQQQPQGYERLG